MRGTSCPALIMCRASGPRSAKTSVDPSARASSVLGRSLIQETNAGVTHADVAYVPSAGVTVDATYLSSPTTAAKITPTTATKRRSAF